MPQPINSIRTIPLSGGYSAIVDAADFDRLNQHKWTAVEARPGIVYAMRHRLTPDGRMEAIYLHRVVLGLEPGDGLEVDHRNHVGTDCRRSNLRPATTQQNQMNRARNRNNKSGFKGVSFNATLAIGRRWVAKLGINGVSVVLGHFADPIDAAKCYDRAAVAHYGEFAFTNFPTAASPVSAGNVLRIIPAGHFTLVDLGDLSLGPLAPFPSASSAA